MLNLKPKSKAISRTPLIATDNATRITYLHKPQKSKIPIKPVTQVKKRAYSHMRVPSFKKLLDISYEGKLLSTKQKEATLEFLEHHITYCDEIFEHLTKGKKPLVSQINDQAFSDLNVLEVATDALLKRIRAEKGAIKALRINTKTAKG